MIILLENNSKLPSLLISYHLLTALLNYSKVFPIRINQLNIKIIDNLNYVDEKFGEDLTSELVSVLISYLDLVGKTSSLREPLSGALEFLKDVDDTSKDVISEVKPGNSSVKQSGFTSSEKDINSKKSEGKKNKKFPKISEIIRNVKDKAFSYIKQFFGISSN